MKQLARFDICLISDTPAILQLTSVKSTRQEQQHYTQFTQRWLSYHSERSNVAINQYNLLLQSNFDSKCIHPKFTLRQLMGFYHAHMYLEYKYSINVNSLLYLFTFSGRYVICRYSKCFQDINFSITLQICKYTNEICTLL